MSGTTSRGYPFPHDADPINVARDIELLAEAINQDIVTNMNTGSAQDAAQNVAIANLQAGLAQNAANDSSNFNFLWDIDKANANNVNALGLRMNAAEADIDALQAAISSAGGLTSGRKYYAANQAVTCDAQGYAEVFFPAGTFSASGPDQQVIVALQDSGGGGTNIADWTIGGVWGTAPHGFGSFWHKQNGTIMAGSSVIVSYIACGKKP